ncbi:MAG: hypothetical protein WAL95_03085 [Candidatus Acidiferrales bacterium]
MKRLKVLHLVLVGTIVGEALISARHCDGVPQPHIEFEITVPFVPSVSTISANMVSVIYISSARMDEAGRPGRMTEPIMFPSVHDAMGAPFPTGYESAALWAEKIRYVYYSSRFGWEAC